VEAIRVGEGCWGTMTAITGGRRRSMGRGTSGVGGSAEVR
jgi:hypothetical protein